MMAPGALPGMEGSKWAQSIYEISSQFHHPNPLIRGPKLNGSKINNKIQFFVLTFQFIWISVNPMDSVTCRRMGWGGYDW